MDEVRKFMGDVSVAQAMRSEYVEAPESVILHFLPGGVGEAGYFYYQGVKVIQEGRAEAVAANAAKTVEESTFGTKNT